MDVTNPVSPFVALLVLALPGVWLAGRTLTWIVIEDRWSARLAVPGMSLALWVLALHVAGLLSGSFHVAIWAGTVAVAAGGFAGLHFARRGRITPPADGWQPSHWMWVGAVIAMAVIAPVTFGWAFHDELFLDGHMSMTAAIQNGGYPPRSLSFPATDLRYHYGFALLNAALGSIFRLRIDTGIDLISLAMWGYLFVLFWAMGDRLPGGRGWITALVVLFGGGLPYLCAATSASRALMLVGVCSTGGTVMNPPFVSYFFQHPWSVGMPIALVLLAAFFSETRPRLRYPAMAVLLTALSICQFVLFSALGAALVVAETWKNGTVSFRRGLAMLVTSGAALAAASRLGGFFADTPVSFFTSLTFHPGVAEGTVPIIRWHLVTLGLLVPLGIAGMILMKGGRLLVFCLVAGSLVIVNTVRYPYSWDIIKFAVIASVGLSVAASIAIARMLETRRTVPVRMAGGGALIGTITAGLLFLAVFTVDMQGIPDHTFERSPMPVSPDDAGAISWLRRHVATGQTVYRSRPEAIAYAQRGGLPQALIDGMALRFGFSSFVPVDRTRLFRELPADPEAYSNRNITWFVIGSEEDRLNTLVRSWLDSGRAIQRATFGELRVIELPAGP